MIIIQVNETFSQSFVFLYVCSIAPIVLFNGVMAQPVVTMDTGSMAVLDQLLVLVIHKCSFHLLRMADMEYSTTRLHTVGPTCTHCAKQKQKNEEDVG